MTADIVSFLRQRDYRLIRELGQGGFGKTVLLLDDVIDEHFVCKKFAPTDSGLREEFFQSFMNEIKLMHSAYHPNVVRIFGYHAYEPQRAGYIVMEYVEGETIDKYVAAHPDSLSAVFRQTVDAFCYLQERGILHRDIRYGNILVRNDGIVKVIDLGFGKRVATETDFNKSITLNWPFAPPLDFDDHKYDFKTEVYFVGRLFERIAASVGANDGKVPEIIRKMCELDPRERFGTFEELKGKLDEVAFVEPLFSEDDVHAYRTFSRQLRKGLLSIESKSEYITDVERIISNLDALYKSHMLEEHVDVMDACNCLITGSSTSDFTDWYMSVGTLSAFLGLLRHSGKEQRGIILSNLHQRLNGVRRIEGDEIPF